MTRAAKITYLAALLVGLSVGLLSGYRQRMDLLQEYGETRLMTAPLALGDFSHQEYVHADVDHARAALLTYAGLLEQMEKARPGAQEYELSNTYVRLALLEDEERNSEQSRQFMAKARYWHMANHAGGQDLSDSEVKAAQTRIDERLGLSRSQVGSR